MIEPSTAAYPSLRVTLCGSMRRIEWLRQTRATLEALGHLVQMPPDYLMVDEGKAISAEDFCHLQNVAPSDHPWAWRVKHEAMMRQFANIRQADLVLVVNPPSQGIKGHIGVNTAMEIAVARAYNKPLACLYSARDSYGRRSEIHALDLVELEGDLSRDAVWTAYQRGLAQVEQRRVDDAKASQDCTTL